MPMTGVLLLWDCQWQLHTLWRPGGVASDTRKVITVGTASFLLGVVERDEEHKDSRASLEEYEEESEDNEIVLDDC